MAESMRACCVCSRFFHFQEMICTFCWKNLIQQMNSNESLLQKDYPFPTYSLFTWRNQGSVRKLIYGMKGGGSKETAGELARYFWSRYTGFARKALVFIPAPGRELGSKDHACLWAEGLLHAFGGAIVNPLQRNSGVVQKHLDRESRFQKKLILSNELDIPEERPIVFVDDIITSGATAWSAYEALKKPRNFEVWTIGCRPREHLL